MADNKGPDVIWEVEQLGCRCSHTQTAVSTAEMSPASLSRPECDNNTMHATQPFRRERDRKQSLARPIKEYSVRVVLDPTGSTMHRNFCISYCSTIPAAPIRRDGSSFFERTRLIGKNDHIVAKYHEQVADFFTVAITIISTLVSIHVRISPKAQKSALTKLCEISLRRCGSA